MAVMSGEAYTQSERSRAVEEPSAKSLIWDDTLYDRWSNESVTAEEWIQRFQLARNKTLDDLNFKRINSNDINQEHLFTQKIKNMQSVRKRKQLKHEEMSPVEYQPNHDFDVKPEAGYSQDDFARALNTIDTFMHKLVLNVNSLQRNQTNFFAEVHPLLVRNEQCTEDFEASLGTKPPFLFNQFDSPSLWSSLGLIGSEVVDISNRLNLEVKKKGNTEEIDNLHDRLDLIKKAIISLTDKVTLLMKGNPRQVSKVDPNETLGSMSTDSEDSSKDTLMSGDDIFETLLEGSGSKKRKVRNSKHPISKIPDSWKESIERELASIKALSDANAVQFCSLGFKCRQESDSWLSEHGNGDHFGYVVDVHTICEHLYTI